MIFVHLQFKFQRNLWKNKTVVSFKSREVVISDIARDQSLPIRIGRQGSWARSKCIGNYYEYNRKLGTSECWQKNKKVLKYATDMVDEFNLGYVHTNTVRDQSLNYAIEYRSWGILCKLGKVHMNVSLVGSRFRLEVHCRMCIEPAFRLGSHCSE